MPSLLPAGPRMALHHAWIALVLGGWAAFRRVTLLEWARVGWHVALGGALVIAGPATLITWAGGQVPGLTEEFVFLLTPVVVIFVVAQRSGFGDGEDSRRLLGPALAGIAGAALLMPFRFPASTAGTGWLLGLVLVVGLSSAAAIWLHDSLRRVKLLPAFAMIALASTCVFSLAPGWGWVGGLSAAEWIVEIAKALLLDGPLLVLGVWLLREMAPVRYSARVLVILLIAIVESFVAARPTLTWTMVLGAGLMVLGAGWLLRKGAAE